MSYYIRLFVFLKEYYIRLSMMKRVYFISQIRSKAYSIMFYLSKNVEGVSLCLRNAYIQLNKLRNIYIFPFLIVDEPRWNLCGILVARSGSWKVTRKKQKKYVKKKFLYLDLL